MSYRIVDISGEWTDRQTGARAIMAELSADTVSDLPSNTANLQYVLGSWARTVDTGDIYRINSSGVWVLQPSTNAWQNVYTKSELEKYLAVIPDLVDDSEKKNMMKLSGSNVTGYGIQCTFDNVAGTITLDGINSDKKCTGSFNVQAADSRVLGLESGVVYHFSCDGYETSNETLGIYVYTSGATPLFQFDCFMNNEAAWNPAWEQASGFRLFIRKGTVVDNIVLKPMICKKTYWDISEKFVPAKSN